MDREYRRAANITVVVAGLFLLCRFILKYALSALMPFFLAALVAALISPLVNKLGNRSSISKRLSSAVILILLFAALSALFYLGISRLVLELGDLLRRLSEEPEVIGNTIEKIAERLNRNGSRLAFLKKLLDQGAPAELGIDINALLQNALSSLLSSLTSYLPQAAVSLIKEIPSSLLFVIVFLISAFYFSADGREIAMGLSSILPERWRKKLPIIGDKIKKTLVGYAKAYFLLMLLTFVEMLIGLSIIGAKYAFIMAIVISVVDVLPILGAGTVLIPWAVFAFLSSNTPLGVGLLILYAVTLVIRQFAEPKIVGKTLGLHPLATLASVYLGLRFLGFLGLFAGPMIALLLREMFFKGSGKAERRESACSDKEMLPPRAL